MAAPNMATITASLERSFQNCSLNNQTTNSAGQSTASRRVLGTGSSSSTSTSSPHHDDERHQQAHHDRHRPHAQHHNGGQIQNANDTTLELNSHISLPYHWEQCLDLKTGEIYYINWRNGMKAKEDPRTSNYSRSSAGDYDQTEEDDDEEEEEEEVEESSFDSEESSSESSEYKYGDQGRSIIYHNHDNDHHQNQNESEIIKKDDNNNQEVLVVGGCKSCFMYFMVPKHVQDCPKCCGQLLHFDRSENGSL